MVASSRIPNMKIVGDLLVNIAANVICGGSVIIFGYVKRRWIVEQISKIKWNLSGDVWWFACDLHSIKLQADLGRIAQVRDAICQALGHAHTIGVDDDVLLQIRKLNEIDPNDKVTI